MITTKQRSKLKALANTLKPTVIIGKGDLTDNIVNEIEVGLYNHELVKVSALKSCESTARDMCADVCNVLGCDPVIVVGNRFVVYKRSDKKDIEHIDID